MILAVAMIMGLFASFATAASAAEAPVFVRMDYSTAKDIPTWKTNTVTSLEVKSDGDARSAYFEAKGTSNKNSFYPKIDLPRNVMPVEKFVLSYDYKVEGNTAEGMTGNTGTTAQFWDGNDNNWAMDIGSVNLNAAWPAGWSNSLENAGRSAKVTSTWARYDFVFDKYNKKVYLYYNGEYVSENNISTEDTNEFVKQIRFNYWTPGTVSVDNITAATTDALTAENATIKVNGKNMYINYPSTIKSDSTIPTSAYLEEVGGSGRIQANAVSQSTKSIIKLELASAPEKNTEYRVVYNDDANIKNFLGGSMNDDVTYIETENEKETVELVKNEGFDSDLWKNLYVNSTNPNYTPGYTFIDAWSNNVKSATDPEDSDNYVLRFFDGYAKYSNTMAYTLPENMPSDYELNVSYKIKAKLTTNGAMFGLGISSSDATDTAKDHALGLAFTNNSDDNKDGVYYATGRWWCGENFTSMISKNNFDRNVWYEVTQKYNVKKGQSPTVTYSVAKGGTKTTEAFESAIISDEVSIPNTANVKTIKKIYFTHIQDNKANETDNYYIDDFKLSYTADKVSMLHTRMLDAQGKAIMPSKTPENTISGMQFTLSDAVAGVTAKLDDEDATVTQNDNVYKVTWNKFLDGNEHTVELKYGTNTYTYKFTPGVAKDLIVKSFGAYVGDAAAEKTNLTAGATVKVKAKIANPTGDATKTACIMYALYDGDTIKSVNYASKVIGTDIAGEDIEKTFEIPTGITNPNLKLFLWDAIDGMIPLTNSSEI